MRRLKLFLILAVAVFNLFGSDTISLKTDVVSSGTYKPDTVLKVTYSDDKNSYLTFIKTDMNGNWVLHAKDIYNLEILKDGDVRFDVTDKKTGKNVSTFSKNLDKGLELYVEILGRGETVSDGFLNRFEVDNVTINLYTEENIKELNLTIEDANKTKQTFTLDDFQNDTITGVDFSKFQDGVLYIEATAQDSVGNKATYQAQIIKDTQIIAPKLTKRIKNNNLNNVVNKKIIVAQGLAEPFADVYFSFKQNDVEINESVVADEKGRWQLLGSDLDVSQFENGTVEAFIYQIDLAKNKSRVLQEKFLKFKRPIFPLTPLPIDAQKYQLIYTINDNEDAIYDVKISKKFIYGASYEVVKMWGKSYAKLKATKRFKNLYVNSLALGDRYLFAALSNGYIAVLTSKELNEIYRFKADKIAVYKLLYADGVLISGGANGAIKIWDIKNKKLIKTLKKHQWEVKALFVRDGLLYSGGDDGDLRIWDLKNYKLVKTIKSAHFDTINDILVTQKYIITAGDDKRIVIRDRYTYKIFKVLKKHKKGVKALSTVNNYLLSVSDDKNVFIWSMDDFQLLKRLKGHTKGITSVLVADYNIVTSSRDKTIKIWGYDDTKESLDLNDETNLPIYSLLKSIPLHAKITKHSKLYKTDNFILLTTYGSIKFWDITTHDYKKSYSTEDKIVKIVAKKKKKTNENEEEESISLEEYPQKVQDILCADVYGDRLYAVLEDKTIKVWDLESNQAVDLITTLENTPKDIKVTDNYIVVALENGYIAIIDKETQEIVNLIDAHQHYVNSIYVYANKIFSGGFDYNIAISDIESGDVDFVLKNISEDIIDKIVANEDYIIFGSQNGIVKIIDMKTKKLLSILSTHLGAISDITLDEEHIFTASIDGTVKVWSGNGFKEVKTLNVSKKGVSSVIIADDYIITLSKDKKLKVWKYYE